MTNELTVFAQAVCDKLGADWAPVPDPTNDRNHIKIRRGQQAPDVMITVGYHQFQLFPVLDPERYQQVVDHNLQYISPPHIDITGGRSASFPDPIRTARKAKIHLLPYLTEWHDNANADIDAQVAKALKLKARAEQLHKQLLALTGPGKAKSTNGYSRLSETPVSVKFGKCEVDFRDLYANHVDKVNIAINGLTADQALHLASMVQTYLTHRDIVN